MKKICIILIILVITVFFIVYYIDKPLDYDNYDEMMILESKSDIELNKAGYSELSIEKIKAFTKNMQNHQTLLNMINNDEINKYGYNNRILTEGNTNEVTYKWDYFTEQDKELLFGVSVLDMTLGQTGERNENRLLLEFEWMKKNVSGKHFVNIYYPNHVLTDIYTLLEYCNTNDDNDKVFLMAEINPYNNIEELNIEIDTRKTINQKNYYIEKGTIIIDIESYYLKGITPLDLTTQYVKKNIIGQLKTIAEHKLYADIY